MLQSIVQRQMIEFKANKMYQKIMFIFNMLNYTLSKSLFFKWRGRAKVYTDYARWCVD